jgi:hypothetical protein
MAVLGEDNSQHGGLDSFYASFKQGALDAAGVVLPQGTKKDGDVPPLEVVLNEGLKEKKKKKKGKGKRAVEVEPFEDEIISDETEKDGKKNDRKPTEKEIALAKELIPKSVPFQEIAKQVEPESEEYKNASIDIYRTLLMLGEVPFLDSFSIRGGDLDRTKMLDLCIRTLVQHGVDTDLKISTMLINEVGDTSNDVKSKILGLRAYVLGADDKIEEETKVWLESIGIDAVRLKSIKDSVGKKWIELFNDEEKYHLQKIEGDLEVMRLREKLRNQLSPLEEQVKATSEYFKKRFKLINDLYGGEQDVVLSTEIKKEGNEFDIRRNPTASLIILGNIGIDGQNAEFNNINRLNALREIIKDDYDVSVLGIKFSFDEENNVIYSNDLGVLNLENIGIVINFFKNPEIVVENKDIILSFMKGDTLRMNGFLHTTAEDLGLEPEKVEKNINAPLGVVREEFLQSEIDEYYKYPASLLADLNVIYSEKPVDKAEEKLLNEKRFDLIEKTYRFGIYVLQTKNGKGINYGDGLRMTRALEARLKGEIPEYWDKYYSMLKYCGVDMEKIGINDEREGKVNFFDIYSHDEPAEHKLNSKVPSAGFKIENGVMSELPKKVEKPTPKYYKEMFSDLWVVENGTDEERDVSRKRLEENGVKIKKFAETEEVEKESYILALNAIKTGDFKKNWGGNRLKAEKFVKDMLGVDEKVENNVRVVSVEKVEKENIWNQDTYNDLYTGGWNTEDTKSIEARNRLLKKGIDLEKAFKDNENQDKIAKAITIAHFTKPVDGISVEKARQILKDYFGVVEEEIKIHFEKEAVLSRYLNPDIGMLNIGDTSTSEDIGDLNIIMDLYEALLGESLNDLDIGNRARAYLFAFGVETGNFKLDKKLKVAFDMCLGGDIVSSEFTSEIAAKEYIFKYFGIEKLKAENLAVKEKIEVFTLTDEDLDDLWIATASKVEVSYKDWKEARDRLKKKGINVGQVKSTDRIDVSNAIVAAKENRLSGKYNDKAEAVAFLSSYFEKMVSKPIEPEVVKAEAGAEPKVEKRENRRMELGAMFAQYEEISMNKELWAKWKLKIETMDEKSPEREYAIKQLLATIYLYNNPLERIKHADYWRETGMAIMRDLRAKEV